MKDLSIKEFSNLVYDKLNTLTYKQILSNPTAEDKEKEIIELHTPLKSINKTENAFPILSSFQISITCWSEEQSKSIDMTSEVETELRKLNFVGSNTNPTIYDTTLQKYGITVTFEVRYNSITDSFQFIK